MEAATQVRTLSVIVAPFGLELALDDCDALKDFLLGENLHRETTVAQLEAILNRLSANVGRLRAEVSAAT